MPSLENQQDSNGVSTGTVKTVDEVIPELNRKEAYGHGLLNVHPFPMSALDLTYHLKKAGKHIGIKKVVKLVSEGPLQGILGYTEDPVVF